MAGRPRLVKVEWARDAINDLDRLRLFVAQYDVERADRIRSLILSEGGYLARHPTFGRRIDETGCREWTMVRQPYVLRYRVDEDMDTLRILRVWHSRENREG